MVVVGKAHESRCFVYLPLPYTGRGPAESCIQIVREFDQANLTSRLFLPRHRRRPPETIDVIQALAPGMRHLPWSMTRQMGLNALDRLFLKQVERADPENTILYFWPDPPIAVLERCRTLGFKMVREMINSACATARTILDEAYTRQGMEITHKVTEQKVAAENAELQFYDYIFASNPEVEKSLKALSIPGHKILPTSFGWRPERFAKGNSEQAPRPRLRVAFVGSIGVRKGVPELLAAWNAAKIDGELVLAGTIEPDYQAQIEPHLKNGSIVHLDFVEEIEAFYRSCDFFVFPTLEEGGPQVTYEAAGCALPIVTTPMGAARLVESGETGIVVPPANSNALAEAMRTFAENRDLRLQMGEAARVAAARFRYSIVGRQRADYLQSILHANDVGTGQSAT